MRNLTKVEEKLAVLKAILSGEQSFDILRPPEHYCIIQMDDGTYYMGPGESYTEVQYQLWLKTTKRECDSLILFVPAPGCAPLIDNSPKNITWCEEKTYEDGELTETVETLDVDYTEVYPLLEASPVDEEPQRKTQPLKTPANAVRIAPRLITQGKLSEYGITWGSICR